MPGYNSQRLGTAKFVICVVLFVIRVVLLLIVMFYVLFVCKCVLPPGVNPIAVNKYISIYIALIKINRLIFVKYGALCTVGTEF
jgi:hypothetical protein